MTKDIEHSYFVVSQMYHQSMGSDNTDKLSGSDFMGCHPYLHTFGIAWVAFHFHYFHMSHMFKTCPLVCLVRVSLLIGGNCLIPTSALCAFLCSSQGGLLVVPELQDDEFKG